MLQTTVCVLVTLSCVLRATTAGPIPDTQTNTTDVVPTNTTTAGPIPDTQTNTTDVVPTNATRDEEPPSPASTTHAPTEEIQEEREERCSCPGYYTGPKDRENCVTGTRLGAVDHMDALGMTSADWSSCGLPSLPEANQHVCYKTTVYECDDSDYRVYLKPRNMTVLQNQCPGESPTGDLRQISHSNTVVFNSPRYGCINPNNKRLRYRKSEFCLYNISIPDCWAGVVTIESSVDVQSLQERDDDGKCRDYLQFFSGSFTSQRYCGSELSTSEGFELTVPSLQFLAVFWTDSGVNAPGFQLTASCPSNTTAHG